MKTNKILATLVAVTLVTVLWLSSTYAAQNGPWDGTWYNATMSDNSEDTNDNGIADGQEDWDNDGILNKDDEDYEKSYVNMQDDDGDGIPNSEDEDYVRDPAMDGTGNPDKGDGINNNYGWYQSWSVNTWNAYANKVNTFTQKKSELKAKISNKYTWVVDWLMNSFENKYKNMTLEQIKVKYQALLWNVNQALKNIENSNYSDDKKEAFRNIFEYIKVQAEEKIAE